jgi:hypothetical protein
MRLSNEGIICISQMEISYAPIKCFYCVMRYHICPQMESLERLLYYKSNIIVQSIHRLYRWNLLYHYIKWLPCSTIISILHMTPPKSGSIMIVMAPFPCLEKESPQSSI